MVLVRYTKLGFYFLVFQRKAKMGNFIVIIIIIIIIIIIVNNICKLLYLLVGFAPGFYGETFVFHEPWVVAPNESSWRPGCAIAPMKMYERCCVDWHLLHPGHRDYILRSGDDR